MDFFSMQPIILILNYGPSTHFSPTGPLQFFHVFTLHQAGPVGLWVQSSRPSDGPLGDRLPPGTNRVAAPRLAAALLITHHRPPELG
jgi:hypothetical protein